MHALKQLKAKYGQTLNIFGAMASSPTVLNAFLALEGAIADSRGHVDDTAWKTAVEAGWWTEQLLEAYADTVRTIFTNSFNHLVHTEQDVPEAPEL